MNNHNDESESVILRLYYGAAGNSYLQLFLDIALVRFVVDYMIIL